MRIFNFIWCFLFIIFAALQYNDPDPYIWMPIYLYAAVLCYLAAKKQFFPKAYFWGIFLYLIYAGYLLLLRHNILDWFEHHHVNDIVEHMKADKPWIEETREFGGLLILVIVLGLDWIQATRLKNHRRS
ncbi:Transmembrane family 220, helix [bacterium A37T11]|nr:Transmembrane family 220, helix [bacterium A37T11]